MLNILSYHEYFLKINLTCSKRQLIGQINEILQNDVNKWRHLSKTGHGMDNDFFSK